MKTQLIPFSIIILSASLMLLFYIFFNIYYGKQYEKYSLEIKIIDKFRNIIEIAKSYLTLSLTYSSHQAMREHACIGGITKAGEWICNGPNPVPIEKSKECLEEYTKSYLNIYFELLETSLPLNIIKINFSECKYGITPPEVLIGKYDEGYFWVNCSGGKILLSTENVKQTEKLEINQVISKNRFWYIFRILTEWANEDVYSPCICECTSSCAGCECAEKCAKMAFDDLIKRFDEFVICEMKKICCERTIGESCLSPSPCLPWTEDNPCPLNCLHECVMLSEGKICSLEVLEKSMLPDLNTYLSSLNNRIFFSSEKQCYCLVWRENKLSSHYEIKCEDHKYYIPTSKGPMPLIFKISMGSAFKDQDACKSIKSCKCPENMKSCEECYPENCCTRCFE
ncbi:MAG: hypothetical protein QXD89_00545 [Candidatus Aenigmatarchaeota archaeon]